MTVYDKFKGDIENPDKKILEVTTDDFKEILEDSNTIFGPLKPKPPIAKVIDKIEYQRVRVGLFKFQMQKLREHKEVHYDYQDKNYLEQMVAYKKQEKKVNELYFHGKQIILKDENNAFKI